MTKDLCPQTRHEMAVLYGDCSLWAAVCSICGYRAGVITRPLTDAATTWLKTGMFA